MIYKLLHEKLKIEQPPLKVIQVSLQGKYMLLHVWYLWCYTCYNPGNMS